MMGGPVNQLVMDFGSTRARASAKDDRTIAERFEEYLRDNPHIWAEFCRMARTLKDRGVEHYGAKSIFEAIRYHTVLAGNDGFKVNNVFSSRFARKLMAEQPEFSGFFELRELQRE